MVTKYVYTRLWRHVISLFVLIYLSCVFEQLQMLYCNCMHVKLQRELHGFSAGTLFLYRACPARIVWRSSQSGLRDCRSVDTANNFWNCRADFSAWLSLTCTSNKIACNFNKILSGRTFPKAHLTGALYREKERRDEIVTSVSMKLRAFIIFFRDINLLTTLGSVQAFYGVLNFYGYLPYL
jgi:hypothetical protein